MVHGNASDDYSKKKNVTYKMIATIVMMIFSSMTREREKQKEICPLEYSLVWQTFTVQSVQEPCLYIHKYIRMKR